MYNRGVGDIVTILSMISGVETVRSLVDWIIFKIQRKVNLSNSKKEKLCTTITLLPFYSIAIIVLLLRGCSWKGLLNKQTQLKPETKQYYLIQVAFWFSCSIRNIEAYFKKYSGGAENDKCSKAALLYLISCLIGYCSVYAEDGIILLCCQYITELCYQLYRILWIFDWDWSLNKMFLIWSAVFIMCRIGLIWWTFMVGAVFIPIFFIQVYLLWSFTVLQLAKCGLIQSQRNYSNGEVLLKTPRIFRPWLKSAKFKAAKLKAARFKVAKIWLKDRKH